MSELEMGIRERKKQRTRQALRQAAARLFLERGFEATTIADIAADMQTQSDQEPAMARVIRSTPAIQARIRDRMGQWEEQLAAMIAQERNAPPDDLDSHLVAAALVGVLRSVQRVAVAAEMQLDLPALMD